MIQEENTTLFPFVCDDCGHIVEEDNGSPLDYLCYNCLEEGLPK